MKCHHKRGFSADKKFCRMEKRWDGPTGFTINWIKAYRLMPWYMRVSCARRNWCWGMFED